MAKRNAKSNSGAVTEKRLLLEKKRLSYKAGKQPNTLRSVEIVTLPVNVRVTGALLGARLTDAVRDTDPRDPILYFDLDPRDRVLRTDPDNNDRAQRPAATR